MFANIDGEQSLQGKITGRGFVDKVVSVSNLVFAVDVDNIYDVSVGTAELRSKLFSWKSLLLDKFDMRMHSDDGVMNIDDNMSGV